MICFWNMWHDKRSTAIFAVYSHEHGKDCRATFDAVLRLILNREFIEQ